MADLRESDSLTNAEAAELLGVHPNTIVNWKRNGTIREFSREEVQRMRREMWEQFAPATEMPEKRGPA